MCADCKVKFFRALVCDWHAATQDGAICFHCFVALMLDGKRCDRAIFRGSGTAFIRAEKTPLQLCGFCPQEDLWYGLTTAGELKTFESGTTFYAVK